MKLTGEHRYDLPRDEVFEAILDPEVLSRTLPGCEDLKQTAEHEFSGKLKMKVGPVQGVFQGKVTLSELDPPNGYRLKIDGRGAPGFMSGDGLLTLEDDDGGTLLRYDIDAQVGGRIASVGQRLLESSAKVITRQGLEGLAVQLEARKRPGAETDGETEEAETSGNAPTAQAADANGATEPSTQSSERPLAAPAPPSQAKFIGAVVTGVLGDLLPKRGRPLVAIAALLGIAIVVAVSLRACS